ncbi:MULTISPECIES: DUF1905 domain-containing protein [Microbacterium]|uniref:DUF1905 domain-containing protein n=1 Tax=Microbacterium TaxID=33882 RepID=UPI00277FDBE0|nr:MULTISPECIES: DUF1905 domain-containing protein [Microbacterium]MDQ1085069.1 hypothetical protein [Microbacterium sp. SORGH_AS_0344]MDQ1169654.1 hypothetical protein [Microbacterium proteolyticum]
MRLRFSGPIWYWRGPAPFHFVSVPSAEAAMIAEIAPVVTYGWGMIPASVTVGTTTVTTSLWPKDGGYIVPVKKALQDAEDLAVDDEIEVTLDIDA